MIRKHLNLLLISAVLMASAGLVSPNPFADVEISEADANPALMLNGKVTNENALASVTTGKLSLEAWQAASGKTEPVPFYAYLIRAGKIVDADAFAHNNAVTEIEMSAILKPAKDGDRMIIDPAVENTKAKRRVIIVKQYRFIWWPWQNGQAKDGC